MSSLRTLELSSGYQRREGVEQPPVERQTLKFLEEVVVVEGDRVGRDVLLHAVLPRPVGIG